VFNEILPNGDLTMCFNFCRGRTLRYVSYTHYEVRVSSDERRQIKEAEDHNEELKKIHKKIRTSKYFAKDCSKMENKPFVAFASI
jgi:hypothetical protein